MAHAAAIAVDKLLHHVVVWHLYDGRHAAKSLLINLFLVDRVYVWQVTLGVWLQVCLCIVDAKQTVVLEGQCLRQVDYFFFSFLVSYSDFRIVVGLRRDGAVECEKRCYYQQTDSFH